jgi:hypothetical protein
MESAEMPRVRSLPRFNLIDVGTIERFRLSRRRDRSFVQEHPNLRADEARLFSTFSAEKCRKNSMPVRVQRAEREVNLDALAAEFRFTLSRFGMR